MNMMTEASLIKCCFSMPLILNSSTVCERKSSFSVALCQTMQQHNNTRLDGIRSTRTEHDGLVIVCIVSQLHSIGLFLQTALTLKDVAVTISVRRSECGRFATNSLQRILYW